MRWAIELVFVAVAFAAFNGWQRHGLLPDDGELAPTVTFRDLDGAPVALESFRGQRVVLHFWATWCGVCRMEHGALNAIERDWADDPTRVVIAAVADGTGPDARARIRAYIDEHDIEYRVVIADEATRRAFRVDRFPTNYFIDEAGRIAARDVGLSTRWTMRARAGCDAP